MTENEKQALRNGREPWKEEFPNGSVATWFSGHLIHVTAPHVSNGKVWSKSFSISFCDNRKYGEHSNAVKRNGVWYYLKPIGLSGGYCWE